MWRSSASLRRSPEEADFEPGVPVVLLMVEEAVGVFELELFPLMISTTSATITRITATTVAM